jgi:hypothetical protein
LNAKFKIGMKKFYSIVSITCLGVNHDNLIN